MLKDTSGDLFTFLIAVGFGIILCLTFDIIKAIRKSQHHTNAVIFAEDVLFSVFAGLLTYLLLFLRVYGEIRWFVFFGEIVGFVLSRIMLTNYVVKAMTIVIKFLKKLVFSPLKKVFLIVSSFINENINDFFAKFEKKLKKSLKQSVGMVYNKRKSAKHNIQEVND